MATRPLNLLPSTKTGQMRNMPPARKETDAKPAQAVAVERPKFDAIRIGRHESAQQSDGGKGQKHPAVAAVLALAWAEIAAGEEDAMLSPIVTIKRPTKARCEKKGPKPPQPRIARPNWTTSPIIMPKSKRGLGMASA